MVAAAVLTIALAGAIPAQDAADAGGAGGAVATPSMGEPFGGGMLIESFKGDSIIMDPESGEIEAIGKVDLKTDQFQIKCDELRTTDGNQKVLATGSPVIIDDPINRVHAECRNLVYDVKTKAMRLEGGNPFVTQEDDEKITKISNGIIIFTQGKTGKAGLTLLRDPKTGKQPEYATLPKKKPAAADAPKEPAQRVRNNTLDIIKLPQTDQGR